MCFGLSKEEERLIQAVKTGNVVATREALDGGADCDCTAKVRKLPSVPCSAARGRAGAPPSAALCCLADDARSGRTGRSGRLGPFRLSGWHVGLRLRAALRCV
jgi:hypothetical protein